MNVERRSYTAEFKKGIVEQILYRCVPVTQLSRDHQISRVLIYRWVREYRNTGIVKSSRDRAQSQKGIGQLESLVGRLMIDNELLKKALSELQAQADSKEIISGNAEISLDPSLGGAAC